MYKKLKRGGLTPGLKNYVKKEDSQEKMIAVVDKKDGLEKFVKKSEVMKDPSKYFPSKSNYEAALQIAKTKEPGSRLSVPDIERAMQSVQGKIKGGMSKIDKLRSTKGQFTIEGRLQTLKDKMKKTFGKKSGGLTGGQKKLDKNKDGKITGEDFKMMKQGYGAARKDGMGLQDEKVKPGKVQKAFLGIMALKKAKDKGAKGAEFLSPLAMLKRISGKKKGGVAKGGGADMGTEMSDKRKKKFKFIMDRLKSPTTINIRKDYEPGTKSPMQRDRKREGYRAKVESLGGKVLFADEMSKGGGADTGRIGEIKSKLALAKDKFKRIEDKKKPQKPFPVPSLYNNNKKPSAGRIRKGEPRPKKMGEPIGFKSGTMVKARGCKLGRTRPTKMY
jgi:hypothetical protein